MSLRLKRPRGIRGFRLDARAIARFCILLVLTTAAAAAVNADVPTRYGEFVYTVVAFTGRDYSGTFVRQPSNTLYLVANHDSFLEARKTFVYYWPITGNYRLDTSTLNKQFTGKLRVEGRGVSKTLSMERFTYYDLRGKYDLSWKAARGAAADKVYEDYQTLVNTYQQKAIAYQLAVDAYQQKFQAIVKRVIRLRSEGKHPATLVKELESLKQPQAPTSPSIYVAPPVSPQRAFVVNLPVGIYHIEFINPDGTIMQGSQKRLVVFSPHGNEKVGYDVIPADKWTRSETSDLPGSVLYVNGKTSLYLRPYFEAQYNELFHRKLLNNDATGNANMEEWVKLQQVPDAKIVVSDGQSRNVIEQKPYGVQQTGGSSLGYTIVPWAEFRHQPGAKPDLIAYRVPIHSGERLIRVSSLGQTGSAIAGGEREIRVVSAGQPMSLLLVIALLPLAAAVGAVGLRARRYRREGAAETAER